MGRGVEEEEEGMFSSLARGPGWYAAATRMPQSWTTGGIVYAQDDFPQCAIYLEPDAAHGATADDDGGRGQEEGERVSLPATSSRSPLLPFAFTVGGSEEEGGEEDGARDRDEEAIQVVEWKRDDLHPRQECAKGVTLHLTLP